MSPLKIATIRGKRHLGLSQTGIPRMGFGFLFVAPHHPKTTPTPTTGSGPVPLKPHRRGPNPLGKNRLDAKRLAPRAHRHISSLKSVCSRISDHVLGENRSIAREICGPKKGARFPVGVPLGSLKNHPARQLRICFSPHKPWLCLGLPPPRPRGAGVSALVACGRSVERKLPMGQAKTTWGSL